MEKVTITEYIAEDGSKFKDEESFLRYESNCNIHLDTMLPELYMKNLESMTPLLIQSSILDSIHKTNIYKYQWFKLKDKNDYIKLLENIKKLNNSSKLKISFREPNSYPNLIAIELYLPNKLMANEKNFQYSGKFVYYTEEKEKINNYITNIDNSIKE